MRNHGFILTPKGWVLSPAYDINPIPNSYGLKLNITENNNQLNIELALELIDYFRISKKRSYKTIKTIKAAVNQWPIVANKFKLPRTEQELMKSAFQNLE